MPEKSIPPRIAISVPEAAQVIGISVPNAYNLVRAGILPAKKIGKRWVVSVKALEAWINEPAN